MGPAWKLKNRRIGEGIGVAHFYPTGRGRCRLEVGPEAAATWPWQLAQAVQGVPFLRLRHRPLVLRRHRRHRRGLGRSTSRRPRPSRDGGKREVSPPNVRCVHPHW